MNETKLTENIYSRERVETTSIQAPAEATKALESPQTETVTTPSQPGLRLQLTQVRPE